MKAAVVGVGHVGLAKLLIAEKGIGNTRVLREQKPLLDMADKLKAMSIIGSEASKAGEALRKLIESPKLINYTYKTKGHERNYKYHQ